MSTLTVPQLKLGVGGRVALGVGVMLGVSVTVAVGVRLAVAVALGVRVGVSVAVGVTVGSGARALQAPKRAAVTSKEITKIVLRIATLYSPANPACF